MTDPELSEPEVPVLAAPAGGIPDVIDDEGRLEEYAASLRVGTGPVAIDTERAHGFRYTGRAYLVQVRRAQAGTALIDPIPLRGRPALDHLRESILDAEWIIHAASQDLPCLAELRLLPERLFDTELAARLLGYPRVALGTLTEQLLGVRLLKEHSASDWSVRPLPSEWLSYAALDVELLVQLRDVLAEELVATGKQQWAEEEFAYLVDVAGRPVMPRPEPWRRTSGIHGVRTPLGLAVVRELWHERDDIARELDKAPGRILGDEGIAMLATSIKRQPVTITRANLRAIPRFNRREARRYESNWLDAVARAAALPRSDLPSLHPSTDAPPPPRAWAARDSEAFARWEAVRPHLLDLAEAQSVPVENLAPPDAVKRLLWRPLGLTAEAIDAQLAELEVRPWQRALLVPVMAERLAARGA